MSNSIGYRPFWNNGFLELIAVLLLTSLLLLPELFSIYRTNAFDTIPRDPYDAYLLHLAGMEHGFLPGSPFTYRILSVAPALLPLHLFEAPLLTQIENANPVWLNAVFANAVVSYASIVALSVLVYWVARNRLRASLASSLLGLMLVPLLFQFTGTYLTDPFVILYLFVTFLCMERFGVWLLLLGVGIAVNEKIPLIIAMHATLTLFCVRTKKTWATALWALLSCVAYLCVRSVLNFPGYENQTDVSTFWGGLLNSMHLSFSPKGAVRNLLPIAVVLLLALPLCFGKRNRRVRSFPMLPVHTLMIPLLTAVALCTDVQLNVGRNVMHLFPLFLPAWIAWIESLHSPSGTSVEMKQGSQLQER